MDQQLLYPHIQSEHVPFHITGDVVAVSVIGATLVGWLPTIAAGLSVVYLTIQIALAIRAWRRG